MDFSNLNGSVTEDLTQKLIGLPRQTFQ